MIFLSLYCDNIYMFRDFYLDFTMSRRSTHFLARNDAIFEGAKIYVRKKLIIMGANASGKTTFGRILCALQNYLTGKEISRFVSFLAKRYDQSKPGVLRTEFVIGKTAYWLECVFDGNGIKKESVKRVEIFPSYSTKDLRRRLTEAAPIGIYERDENSVFKADNTSRNFVSVLLLKSENAKLLQTFQKGIEFTYLFSDFDSVKMTRQLRVSVEMLNKILPYIDNSVDRIVALKSEDPGIITHTYVIVFKNGDQMTIPDGNLSQVDRTRLSHGTYEALQFLDFITNVKNNPEMMAFADEQLAHLHVEMEAYLVMKALNAPREGQIFCTTHNPELLDLNIAPQMILLFRRNADGFNETLYVSDRLPKNDRRIKPYYDNDYFGVLPDYSVLDEFFEEN